MGQGPFGHRPWGTFDRGVSRPDRIAYVEPTARRIRVEFAGRTVADSRHARKSTRDVFFSEAAGNVICDVYDRYRLLAGNRVAGPAVVEEKDSTTVVHPGYQAEVDASGNMLIAEARV